jgi:hypothetical protein
MIQPISKRLAWFAVTAGAVCGAVLILISIASRNGLLMYLPYIGLGLVCTLYLRKQPLGSFASRFGMTFTSYALATVIIDAYIITIGNPHRTRSLTMLNFLLPLAAMLLIGAVGSAVVSFLAQSGHRDQRLTASSI